MVDVIDPMIPIDSYIRDGEFVISSLREVDLWNKRKVGKFSRTTSGTKYYSPKILLDRDFMDYVGKYFVTFSGRATYRQKLDEEKYQRINGDCIILFFRDDWNKEKH